MSDDVPKQQVSFKKSGRLRPSSSRKRPAADDEEEASTSIRRHESDGSESEDEVTIFQKRKAKRHNPMIQSTSSKKTTRRVTEVDDSEDSETEERNKLLGSNYESSKISESLISKDMGATSTLEIETDHAVDAQAQFERAQKVIKEGRGKADDKVYRGMSAYGQFREKKDSAVGNASSGLVRKGPIRAPTFLRQSVRWDYQPDLCKDYKETGFCGFGDSCKFLHDRTDYKHGWELEREWKEGRYGKDDAAPHAFEISDDDDELPFKCLICRESFTNPVVTKCKHYFCEKCALEHYRKTQRCYTCEKNTGGVFNPAKEIIARLQNEKSKRVSRKGDDEEPSSSGKEDEDHDLPIIQTLPEEAGKEDDEESNKDSDEKEDDNDEGGE